MQWHSCHCSLAESPKQKGLLDEFILGGVCLTNWMTRNEEKKTKQLEHVCFCWFLGGITLNSWQRPEHNTCKDVDENIWIITSWPSKSSLHCWTTIFTICSTVVVCLTFRRSAFQIVTRQLDAWNDTFWWRCDFIRDSAQESEQCPKFWTWNQCASQGTRCKTQSETQEGNKMLSSRAMFCHNVTHSIPADLW